MMETIQKNMRVVNVCIGMLMIRISRGIEGGWSTSNSWEKKVEEKEDTKNPDL